MKLFRPICFVTLLALGVGCSYTLSTEEASRLAAKLANDECNRIWKVRPFTADLYQPKLKDGSYSWGRLDPGGPGGLSARVTFKHDGTEPKVEIWFHTDQFYMNDTFDKSLDFTIP